MENITVGQIIAGFGTILSVVSILGFLLKIYNKVIDTNQRIVSNDILTRANLKATKVMLDHFIEDKVGNGEFRQARQEIDEILIERKVS